MQHFSNGKPLFVARVDDIDSFNYHHALEVFKSIFPSSIIVFLVV